MAGADEPYAGTPAPSGGAATGTGEQMPEAEPEQPAADDAGAAFRSDTDIEETPAAPSPVPSLPPFIITAVPGAGEGAPFPGGLTPSPEAGIQEAVPPPGDGGGIDALTAAEIGLAAALGVLVASILVLAYAGRKR